MFEPIEQSLLDDMIKQIGKSTRWKESENKAFIETIDALKQSYAEIERQRALIERVIMNVNCDYYVKEQAWVSQWLKDVSTTTVSSITLEPGTYEIEARGHKVVTVKKDASGGVKGE